MSQINFEVATERSVDDVKKTIEREINTRLPGGRIKRFWENDVFRLVGMGADAHIVVTPGGIQTTAKLSPPISFMKAKVEQGLRESVERAASGAAAESTNGAGAVEEVPTRPEAIGPAPIDQLAQLRGRVQGVVLDGGSARDEFTENYGRIYSWRPRYVVQPAIAEDVRQVFQFAKEHDLSVSTRGAAHSQSQIAINRDGILLDMKSMGRVLDVDPNNMTATVESGAIWRELTSQTYHHGLVPPVLTNNLSVTVGGTLSIAGVGVASFKHGIQGDNVIEMEIATPDGEIRTCTREQNSDLFWGVLAGLGQVGVITKAVLKLRRPKPLTRTYYLLYDDIRKFMSDSVTIMDNGKWDHFESWASPCPQGLKWVGGKRMPFAKWMFPAHLTVEYDHGEEPDKKALLADIDPYDDLYDDDLPTHEFLNRLEPVFDIWRKLGTWGHKHPWVETVLPWDTAADFMDAILADLNPGVNVGGHCLLWPAKRDASEVPLFMHPDTENLVGFGILPAVPHTFWEDAREKLDQVSELSIAMGGKRYLSGYVNFTTEQWKQHFGDKWDWFKGLKDKYDPDRRLNPGFVPFDA